MKWGFKSERTTWIEQRKAKMKGKSTRIKPKSEEKYIIILKNLPHFMGRCGWRQKGRRSHGAGRRPSPCGSTPSKWRAKKWSSKSQRGAFCHCCTYSIFAIAHIRTTTYNLQLEMNRDHKRRQARSANAQHTPNNNDTKRPKIVLKKNDVPQPIPPRIPINVLGPPQSIANQAEKIPENKPKGITFLWGIYIILKLFTDRFNVQRSQAFIMTRKRRDTFESMKPTKQGCSKRIDKTEWSVKLFGDLLLCW